MAVRPCVPDDSVPLCDSSLRQRLAALVHAGEPAELIAPAWSFTLRLSGPYGYGAQDPRRGAHLGMATRVRARVRLRVEVMAGASGGPAEHQVRLTGTFRSGALGGARPLHRGVAVMRAAGRLAPPSLGYQLHLSAWEGVPLTVRGHVCSATLSPHIAVIRPALSLELWRDAEVEGNEPEQLVAAGLLHLGPFAALRAAGGFWRSAPHGTRPGRLLCRLLVAAALQSWREQPTPTRAG